MRTKHKKGKSECECIVLNEYAMLTLKDSKEIEFYRY